MQSQIFPSISYPSKSLNYHHRSLSPTILLTSTNLCGSGLLLWQRGKSEVWLDNAEVGEQGLGLLVLDAGVDNHIISGDPVDGSGDAVLVSGLERVDDTENLGGVAAGGGRVGEDEADGLLGVDDEHRADGERDSLGIDVGGILVVKPGRMLTLDLLTWADSR